MSDFKILDETTTAFKCSSVCVMLLCHNGEFGVEVVDRKESFGRVFLKDRDEADLVFCLISNKLSKQKRNEKTKKIDDREILKNRLLSFLSHWL
jgi:hypothetical protein